MSGIRHPVIVVGVDGSAEAQVAAQWAAREADRRQLGLTLLHAFTVPVLGTPTAGIQPDFSDALRESGEQALSSAAATVRTLHPNLDIAQKLVNADPRSALVAASADAVMTVVGTRGGGRIPEVLVGSVALHVASHGHSPVAVISPTMTEVSTGPVLLGVDGSGVSEGAVAFAFDEADRRGVQLTAVLAWDDVALRGFARSGAQIGQMEDEEEHAVLAEQLAGWREKYPDVPVHQVVLRGRAAERILHYAGQQEPEQHPQLIVVGSRGRGGLTGLLLGSTSQA